MNVLLSSAGRRVSLLNAFRDVTHARGDKVYAGDASELAPTLHLADGAFRLPFVDDPEYVPVLVDLVTRHRIGVLVPTIDPELPVLAAAQEQFLDVGCRALVSTAPFVGLCGDKWLTGSAYGHAGIATPASWLPDALPPGGLPDRLFVKPRNGSASRDVHRATPGSLSTVLPTVPSAIVQEELTGPEVTIDALFGFDGTPLHYVPRARLRTMAGESVQGVTLAADDDLAGWIEDLMSVSAGLGARGPVTFQAFLTARGPVLIEVNPRFGGGFPLARAAGGDYPSWLVALAAGEQVAPALGQYQVGLYMTRYHVEHFTTTMPW